jgi:hypothetical protein
MGKACPLSGRNSTYRLVQILEAGSDAVEITMTYEGVEYAIRAGLGGNEWVLLISFPDNVGGNPSVVNFSGARNDAMLRLRSGSIIG